MEDIRAFTEGMDQEEIEEMLLEISEDEVYKGKKPVWSWKRPKVEYNVEKAVNYLKSIQDDEHFLFLSMDDHNLHYCEDEFWWSESILEAIESGSDTGWYFCEEYAKRFAK